MLDEATALEVVDPPKEYDNVELYKKWFRTRSAAGLISITPFWEAQKFAVDIAEIAPDTSTSKSSTKCYVDMIDLAVYLRSIVNGTSKTLFPKREQCPSPEAYYSFGGSGELSRVFKIHYWGAKAGENATEGDSNGFAWKCGHFKGTVGNNGQIMPKWNEEVSRNMIKLSRLDMAEISMRVDLALIHIAATTKNGVVEL